MDGKIWRTVGYGGILLLAALLVVGFVRYDGTAAEPTPTVTPTPLPIVAMSCVQARDTIQQAINDYNAEHQEWPTANGQPGDIQWPKLVPNFMAGIPSNDSRCEWQVNSDPVGAVCLQHIC
jgi:hypothetical protein